MADKENTKASGSSSASSSGGGGGSSSGSSAKAGSSGSSGGKIGGSSSGFGGSLSKGGSGKSGTSFGKAYSSTGGNRVSQKVSSKSSGATRNYAKSTAGGGAGPSASPGTRASLGGAKFAPSWVGKNPYQWGNTTAGIQDYGDRDPERQAKIDSLGYAADDPDRSFHYYNPDPSSSKGYLDRANSISTDRNFFQANNFWNTIDGPYESEDARKSDAAQWMTDAQIYGKWAEDHGLSYTDDDGNTVNMADVWKDIWNYANEITGGVGDSESTVAGRDIEAYLTGGKYDSATTQQMLDKAKYFADNAESEKEASRWADYEKSLKIQLEADQKQEKKDNSFLGKAWDTVTGWFEKPERAELGELTDTQKAYQQAAAEDQALSGYATDPLAAAQFAPIAEKRDELAEQVKAENREAGREVYAGMEDEDRLADATESWLGGRGAGSMAGVAGGLYAVDSAFYDNDEIRQLTQQQWQADQAFLTTGDPKFKEESDALQVQIDEAQQRAVENGENGTPLADAAGMLLDSARGMQGEADQKWQDVTEDMSDAGKMAANVAKTGADVAADVVENAIAPGVGTMRMYLGAAGGGAMEQAGRENNDPDSIAAAAVTRAASAWLSTKLVGGMEGVYGKSILGGITDDMISGASPAAQGAIKTLLNTEGVEEGLEDILNYGADLVLNLDEEAQLNWDEVKQDAFVGYVVGVLTNGLSAGINYDSKARHALAEEAMEFAQSGMSIEEAAEIGKESTKDQVVMKPPTSEGQNQNMATSQNAAIQGQDQNVAPAPVSQAQNQNMAASQNQALEGQDQNVAPAPANKEQQNRNLSDAQAAALAGQDQNPAPAPQRATSGPSANTEPYTGPQLPGASYGGGDTIEIGVDEVPVHFAVVPLSELQASHDIYGNPNPNYPSELQPRDRTSEEYQAEARERGAKLNPRKLESYADATTGAPVIRSDGVVISGNGRTLAIDNAFLRGNGSAYTEYLRQNAGRFGIDPASIGEDSVLVRVVDGEGYDWERLAAGGNNSGVTRYNAAEAANADAKVLMSDSVRDILNLLDTTSGTDLKSDSNEAFMRAFIRQVVPDSERGSMTAWKTEPDGTKVSKITADAYNRAKNAIFTAAYGDSEISSQMALSAENGKIIDAMVFSAPKVLAVEAGVQDGTVRNFGLRDHMVNALQLYNDARNAGQSVAQMTANASLFSEYDPDTIYIARLIEEQRTAPRKMQAFFDGLCDKITKIGAPDSDADGFGLLGDEAPETFAFRDVIEGGRENYAAETKDTLPSQDVWGRGSYEELADVAGLNQTQRQAYYRDESRAQRSPTDTGYAGGSEPVTAGEVDARNADGNGADGGLTELASRMLDGDVSDEEYLSLMETEDGRAQLAAALGLPNSDTKTVADGLSVYLLLQNQLQQMQGQQNENVAPTPEQQANQAVNEEQAQAMAESQNATIEGQNTNSSPVQKKTVLDSAKLKGVTATLKKGDQELIQNAIKSRNPQDYIENYGNSNAQRVRLTKYFNAAYSNPAMLLKSTDAEKANLLETALSDDWIYDSDAVLFRLLMEQNPDGSGAEFRFADWARGNGITDPEDIEYLRSKARGLSVNYPELLNYTDTNDLDTMSLRSADEIEEAFAPAAESEPVTEARAPQYGEEGFVNPMGEDITEDVAEEEGRPSLDDLLAEMAEEEGKAPAQQNQDTAGMLLGEEAETPQNAQGNPEEVNSQAEETNSNTDVLNAQETAGNANPEQNTQNPPSKREKISQYFLNTLTESGRAEGLDPVTYNPTSEAESLTNAAMNLASDEQAVLDRLMSSPAWDGELTDAAWLLENKFYKEFVATGDRTNWDAWRKLETYKISQTAKGLQAVAKQSRPGAAGVLEASLNLLEDFKKKGSKENQAVSQQEVAQAEKDVTQVTHRMAEIENEIDQRVDSGMNETEAKAMSKEAYLDLAEKINGIRNTGKMFFGGKKKFRNMLGSQDMDFIQRFVACQAAGIAEDVNYKGKQDRLKQLNTFQKLAQLTGTGTWSRNLQGNATFGLIDLLANNGVAVAVDQIVSKATGHRSTGFELGALSKDARAAAKLALDRSILEVAANIDLAENSAMEGYDLSRTRTFDPNGNLVERVLSRWEQWNGYMLNSSDKFFRGGAARSSADAIRRANARNGYKVNDADVQQTADQVAAYRLFQNNGVVAEHADKLREGLNRFGAGVLKPITGKSYERGQFGLGTALTPYTKVPTNIGVKALEFSPAGAAKGFAEILRTASDAKAGKATMAQQNQAVTDFARGVTGTALIVGLAQLMKNMPFFKDWENEEDKDVKAQNKAEGKSGMQFNIDMMLRAADGDEDPTWRNSDRTIDISSIEPANQLLTAASLISEGMPKGQAILQSAKENFMGLPSVSALKNIEDTIRYTDTPDDLGQTLLNTATSTAGGVASGFIPAPIRHATTVSDKYARDTSGSNATERAVNQFKASVPGLRETLPVKTDNFGNEISAGSLGTRLLNTYGGNKYSEINQSDLSREAERLREATGEQLIPSRNGPSSEKFGDEKVKFTAEERKDWKDEYGQDLSDAVGMLMKSSVYRDADDDLKAELWKNLEGYAKDEVKAEYADDHYLQYESKYDYLDEVDNPITFLTTNKAFDIAEENEDYDIVDTLIGPVGRLSQEEQDLMRKKNSTLMNYYDYLTPNDRGYKVKDAETVRQFKKDAKANAEGRGKTSASGQDKFGSVYDGYRNKAFTDGDVDAIMSKSKTTEDDETGETTVTWDITKGRAAIYLAMRAGGASVQEALDAVKNADVDYDNTIDEKGVKIKAEYEGTNALKRYGSGNSAMWYEFNEIMYPWKNKR